MNLIILKSNNYQQPVLRATQNRKPKSCKLVASAILEPEVSPSPFCSMLLQYISSLCGVEEEALK